MAPLNCSVLLYAISPDTSIVCQWRIAAESSQERESTSIHTVVDLAHIHTMYV